MSDFFQSQLFAFELQSRKWESGFTTAFLAVASKSLL
jgi:hypothetical protein